MVYRQEHPKPQFMRENWVNLNGIWDFEFDFSKSGLERGIEKDDYIFNETINVPFCPESALSGIGYTDFIPACIYRRRFEIEEKLKEHGFLAQLQEYEPDEINGLQ